jgi:hypothetical protein
MGYRSNGYFIIPAAYSAVLAQRVNDYLVEEEQQRIKDKKVADEAGKHYLYGNTKPWNPLTGFNFLTLMEDSKGNQYHKYSIEGWKWYQGSGFPQIVEELLNDIAYPEENYLDSPEDTFLQTTYTLRYTGMAINAPTTIEGWLVTPQLAIFCLQGEDWNDTTVFDPSDQVFPMAELTGSPWSTELPQILVMVDSETVSDPKNYPVYEKLRDKLNALNPTNYGNPYAGKDDTNTFFYWDTTGIDDNKLFREISVILDEFEEIEATGFAIGQIPKNVIGFDDGLISQEISGTSHWDWDIYPNGGWDDTGLDLVDVKEIPIKDIHKI